MDEFLVEFCRSGTFGPLTLGMSPPDMVQRIGEPERIKNALGDDCFQRYRYAALELGMRCFSKDPKTRRGAGPDLALASIRITFSGDEPVTLPEAITGRPIASAASLQLTEAHRLLTERGVEVTRDHRHVLRRPLDSALVLVISDEDGYVSEMTLDWWPRPGGWYYSEEDVTGARHSGPPGP
ncbi:hypothetical protein [Streptomyces sp. I05A-00742]|uniref:hypothetical protein n=1 Tax=Streptomyces sp. I05A-00742 TaxID=2732853 RepID=UPI00148821FD|nr:hypothetical protein [Streptomyces sp. I05A-00742]